ncbi:MAG: EAL domain-containing protein [Lachnospiraceae bacterium]|nr:EAL domain-containing protein [Lachnospiraceae bacterium]
MSEGLLQKFGSFSPVGDLLTLIICILLMHLLIQTFITKDSNFKAFCGMLGFVALAAVFDLIFHTLLASDNMPVFLIYATRMISRFCLFGTFILYVYYFGNLLELPKKTKKTFNAVSILISSLLLLGDILGSVFGYGFTVDYSSHSYTGGFNFLAIGLLLNICILGFMLTRYKERLVFQILQGVMGSYVLCIIIHIIQGLHHQTSFTISIFILPIIALMYLLHSNPYDTETGAIHASSFTKMILDAHSKNRELMIISLHVQDFDKNAYLLRDMHSMVYNFYSKCVKKGTLFRLHGDRLVLVYRIDQNPNYEETNRALVEAFTPLYEKLKLKFKAVFVKSESKLSENNSYPDLFKYIEPKCEPNNFYTVTEDDILNFTRRLYIISELRDIEEKMDLDDPRVIVYCQPVFNVSSGAYDTAEALMRMELPDTGFLFPDMFIPVAEQTDLIHPLSLIILNKTCKVIHNMLENGFHVHRISINFSIQEVRDENFCRDILRIIEQNNIPYEKVAIELTESRNTTDFNMVKAKIYELKEKGILFYLDDFGTGYSNFDRIMELPFDIIKFDRSLVIESGKDKTSEYMVHTFADMFHKLNYRVLYEGVEDTADEARCIRMFAQYLQGYKYSKPIPIAQLENFFSKVNISPL